jgi:hypothetical protein
MDIVSVIIPLYNRFKNLLNAIDSIKLQTYSSVIYFYIKFKDFKIYSLKSIYFLLYFFCIKTTYIFYFKILTTSLTTGFSNIFLYIVLKFSSVPYGEVHPQYSTVDFLPKSL